MFSYDTYPSVYQNLSSPVYYLEIHLICYLLHNFSNHSVGMNNYFMFSFWYYDHELHRNLLILYVVDELSSSCSHSYRHWLCSLDLSIIYFLLILYSLRCCLLRSWLISLCLDLSNHFVIVLFNDVRSF